MIKSFGNRLAKELFYDEATQRGHRFPKDLRRSVRRKLLYLHEAADLNDLRVPPGNRLKLLKGDWQGFYSMRINDQWRVIFVWKDGNAFEVSILDYH